MIGTGKSDSAMGGGAAFGVSLRIPDRIFARLRFGLPNAAEKKLQFRQGLERGADSAKSGAVRRR
jgi:hypothetical protein